KNANHKFMTIVRQILENLSVLAYDNKDGVMPGRTHGRHAIPITYGNKVSAWISEFIMSYERMAESEKRVFQVMMGETVGTFRCMSEIGLEVQKRVADL